MFRSWTKWLICVRICHYFIYLFFGVILPISDLFYLMAYWFKYLSKYLLNWKIPPKCYWTKLHMTVHLGYLFINPTYHELFACSACKQHALECASIRRNPFSLQLVVYCFRFISSEAAQSRKRNISFFNFTQLLFSPKLSLSFSHSLCQVFGWIPSWLCLSW